jgi:hypothetical protein
VQWPDEDSLTEVRSYLTMEASEGENTGTLHQNLEMTAASPGSDTLTIAGSGTLVTFFECQDVAGADTTYCSIDLEYGVTVDDIVVIRYSTIGDDYSCPLSGGISYVGAIDMACEGATQASLTGTWNVVQTFEEGTVTTVVTNGSNQWSQTSVCDW